MDNTIFPFDNLSFLKINAPTGASVNKFTIYDYSPGKTFTLRFKLRFGDVNGNNTANSGIWYLFIGDGTSFRENVAFTGSHSFLGLEFTFGTNGSILTKYRNNSTFTTISGTPFIQGENYIIEIYGNNSLVSENYYKGDSRTIAPNKFDLYINNTLVCDDFSKSQIANDANIDSWMFYGISSINNVAYIFLDEFDYQNSIAENPLPVTLISFNLSASGRNSVLNWVTENELNNAGFVIERSVYGTELSSWERAGFVNGKGTISSQQMYSFIDQNLKAGNYEYRLKQTDYNGNFEYFFPSNNRQITIKSPALFEIKQNYPNPSNPNSIIEYDLPFDANVKLEVFDLTGKTVKILVDMQQKANYYSVDFDGSSLASGVYFYRISAAGNTESFNKTLKMLIIK